jgi:hypothetical protein
MSSKYSCYKSYFHDIIPLKQPPIFENPDFEFSQEQLSYLYFLWRIYKINPNAENDFINFEFFDIQELKKLKSLDYLSFSDTFLSNNTQLYIPLNKQKYPNNISFLQLAYNSLITKAFFIFQFPNWEALYSKCIDIIFNLYSNQSIKFFQFIFCNTKTNISNYLNESLNLLRFS